MVAANILNVSESFHIFLMRNKMWSSHRSPMQTHKREEDSWETILKIFKRERLQGMEPFDYRHSESKDLTFYFFSCFPILPNTKKHHLLTNKTHRNVKIKANQGKSWVVEQIGEGGPGGRTPWCQNTTFSSSAHLYFVSHFGKVRNENVPHLSDNTHLTPNL